MCNQLKRAYHNISYLRHFTAQRGIPVATVAINNSTNAALLAVRILGSASPITRAKVGAYAERLETEVMAKVRRLEEIGWEDYVL